jgi:hypothetical protein
MKYKYSEAPGQLNTDGRFTKRPIVLALIDSGADQIIMPAAIAELFGIDRASCPERSVIGVSME